MAARPAGRGGGGGPVPGHRAAHATPDDDAGARRCVRYFSEQVDEERGRVAPMTAAYDIAKLGTSSYTGNGRATRPADLVLLRPKYPGGPCGGAR